MSFFFTFSPWCNVSFVGNDVHRNWPITLRPPESVLNSRSFRHGSLLLEIVSKLICQWIKAYGKSEMSKYHRERMRKDQITSFQKKQAWRVERNINHWQSEISSYTKGRKHYKGRAGDLNWNLWFMNSMHYQLTLLNMGGGGGADSAYQIIRTS